MVNLWRAVYPRSCLSSGAHDDDIGDESLHYTGCLRISKREQYLSTLSTRSQQRLRQEASQVEQLRVMLEGLPEVPNDDDAGAKARKLRLLVDQYRLGDNKRSPSVQSSSTSTLVPSQMEDVDSLIPAPVIYFKDGKPYDCPGLDGCFPDQKFSVKELLADDENENPLMQDEGSTVRYFHLPANNMLWVEEVMARFYHEQRPKRNNQHIRTRTGMLLRPEFWEAQQNFDSSSEIHARHMKPFCDTIPTDTATTDSGTMALFMPYLHWETGRGQARTAEKIKRINHERSTMAETVVDAQNLSSAKEPPDGFGQHLNTGETRKISRFMKKGAGLVADGAATTELPDKTRQDQKPSLVTEKGKLVGLILRAAAELFEAMDFIIEECLITKYLHKNPPLHPRRTLDQSYYGALRSTNARDKDQVVYRATCPTQHTHCTGKKGAEKKGVGKKRAEKQEKCRECQEEIKKVPRLIMVGQLWLWILDDRTLITSFPRRWGKLRPDTSDVHQSIRTRLVNANNDEINSSYDLALIVMDECSRVFFDRTLSHDRRPKLGDIFAEAIRSITYKQTAAFNQFLIYAHLASGKYGLAQYQDAATQHILLNIQAEGSLLKEAKDIMDEMQIIIRVEEQQQTVMDMFTKQIEQALPSTTATRHSPWLTVARAKRLQASIETRIRELKILLDLARNGSDALKELLTLKQQQAGVIEAREAVKNGEEVFKQGQSIMLLTMVTIIFLPLSFLSSLFGMNAVELNSGYFTLAQEFTYIFPISLGIIIVSFLLAFNPNTFTNTFAVLMRSVISFIYNITTTWVEVNTGLYMLGRKFTAKSNSLRNKQVELTREWKVNANTTRLKATTNQDTGDETNTNEAPLRPSRALTFGSSVLGMSRRNTELSEDVESGPIRANSTYYSTREP
ncbi:hypothetical protein F5B20DRAFT_593450 [Whalleya microplaca]|nr:hypothetical protein F5B20DRAFT_593450 [Whalleya microplaca]